jgi:subtilase family serine protease
VHPARLAHPINTSDQGRNLVPRSILRPRIVLAIALATIAIAGTAAWARGTPQTFVRRRDGRVRLPGHVLPVLARASKVPERAREIEAEANAPTTLTLVLARDDQAGFDQYLRDVYDSHAPGFHRFLTQRQIADQFGPSEQSYEAVRGYLEGNGFQMVEGSANRLTMTVRGTRAGAEHAFDVRIRRYRVGDTTFSANERDPSLPPEIASSVRAIQGFTSLARPKPTIDAVLRTFANSICPQNAISYGENVYYEELLACPVSPFDAYAACKAKAACDGLNAAQRVYYQCYSSFEVAPLEDAMNVALNQLVQACNEGESAERVAAAASAATIDGSGQTIGFVEFDSFDPKDVADYLALLGLPSTLAGNVSKVDVNGGTAPGPNQDEVLLDINTILTLSPGAHVVVYDAPFTGAGSFQPVLNKMISDGVDIISNSWAYCEDQTTAADVDSIDMLFQQAAAVV